MGSTHRLRCLRFWMHKRTDLHAEFPPNRNLYLCLELEQDPNIRPELPVEVATSQPRRNLRFHMSHRDSGDENQ